MRWTRGVQSSQAFVIFWQELKLQVEWENGLCSKTLRSGGGDVSSPAWLRASCFCRNVSVFHQLRQPLIMRIVKIMVASLCMPQALCSVLYTYTWPNFFLQPVDTLLISYLIYIYYKKTVAEHLSGLLKVPSDRQLVGPGWVWSLGSQAVVLSFLFATLSLNLLTCNSRLGE